MTGAARTTREDWTFAPLRGRRVILRRHRPENLAAFARWYRDPEISRLTRYRVEPMTDAEIERYFQARIMGPDTLSFAIHLAVDDRLIGSATFSQLDSANGSVTYHITIGEPDAWGRGYGTEATELMLAHAFGRLGLHRIGLSVFEFNRRAIRCYEKAGFRIEGRLRDAIVRDGRYWDEIQMSILEDERRGRAAVPVGTGPAAEPAAERTGAGPMPAGLAR